MSSPEISDRVAELLRELADQDAETRYLRSEVANLERAALLVSTPSVVNALNKDPSTNSALMIPSASKRLNFMPEEFLETLSEKREDLLKARREYLHVKEEHRRLEEVLKRNRANAEAMSSDLEKFYTKARWRPGSKHAYACPIVTDNENSRLKKQLLEVYAEAQTTQKQMIAQTEQLKELVNKIESFSHVDEEHFKALTELKLKEQELKAVDDEITSCKRIYQQKDKYLAKLSDTTKDIAKIRQIDADKRVAQTALIGHKEQARQADASIRHRALLITLLEERIEIIGEAIRGDASPVNSDASSSNNNNTLLQGTAEIMLDDERLLSRIFKSII